MDISPQMIVWFGFGTLVVWYLNSISRSLRDLREDIKAERTAREAMDTRLSKIEARCEERHK